MRFDDIVSGCSATIRIFADGIPCADNLPSRDNENQQCWIAVKAGQVLSIHCNLEMISKKYQIDLIVDGILRNTWISSEVFKTQTRKSSIEFSTAIVKEVRSLRQCSMTTSSLKNGTSRPNLNPLNTYNEPESTNFEPSDQITVGTIEIHISKVDGDFTHAQLAPSPDQGSKGWEALLSTPGIAGFAPTHEVVLVVPKALSLRVDRSQI